MQVFSSFDHDGSGSIDAKELKGALKKLGVDMNGLDANQLLDKYDTDKGGGIELAEFRQLAEDLPSLVPGALDELRGRAEVMVNQMLWNVESADFGEGAVGAALTRAIGTERDEVLAFQCREAAARVGPKGTVVDVERHQGDDAPGVPAARRRARA